MRTPQVEKVSSASRVYYYYVVSQRIWDTFLAFSHAVLKNIRAQLRLAAVLSLSRARIFFSTVCLLAQSHACGILSIR